MKCRKHSLIPCSWLDGWNYCNYLVSGMSFFISSKACLARQVLKLQFIIYSVVKQTFQCCFPHVEPRTQRVADATLQRHVLGKALAACVAPSKDCFLLTVGCCLSFWLIPEERRTWKASHCLTDFRGVCGSVLTHCSSPWIVCDWIKRGQVTNIHLMLLIKSPGGLVHFFSQNLTYEAVTTNKGYFSGTHNYLEINPKRLGRESTGPILRWG